MNFQGNKLWSVTLKQTITTLCLVRLSHLSTTFLAVGVRGGSVQLYQGRHMVDCISVADTPSAIAFGQLGQEDHVMVVVTLGNHQHQHREMPTKKSKSQQVR